MKWGSGLIISGLAMLLVGPIALSYSQPKSELDGLPDRLSAYFSELEKSANYSACVGIGTIGQQPAADCFGKGPDGRLLTVDTPLQIASVSKHFTAILALVLVKEDVLDLDAPITDVAPELESFENLTLRHLLSNTGGVPNHDRFPEYDAGKEGPIDDGRLLEMVDRHGPVFPPGSAYEYSNFGWRVAALLIERATGQAFADLMHSRVFEPSGLSFTRAVQSSDYTLYPGLEPLGRVDYSTTLTAHPDWNEGAATIVSTVRDMISWQQQLHGGDILDAEQYEMIEKPSAHGYAMGLLSYHVGEERVIAHDGRMVGGSADIQYRSQRRFYSVILSPQNLRLTAQLRPDIGRFAAGKNMDDPLRFVDELPKPGAPVENIHRYQGRYDFGPGFFVRVRSIGKRLLVAANWGDFTELVPVGDTRFMSRTLGATVDFLPNKSGGMALSWDGSQPVSRTQTSAVAR